MSEEKKIEENEFDLDSILDNEIKFGKYQYLILILISFPLILSGVMGGSYIFTAASLNYRWMNFKSNKIFWNKNNFLEFRCEIPSCESDERTFITSWLNFSTPFDKNSNLPKKCERFAETLSSEEENSCSVNSFNQSAIVECRDNFIYENDELTIQNQVSNFHLIFDH